MKKLLLILFPMVLLGAGAAVVLMGIVDVPGISPKKYGKPVKASADPKGGLLSQLETPMQAMEKRLDEETKRMAATAPKEPPAPKPKDDVVKGQSKLAEMWNNLDPSQLADITEKWQPTALAPIILKMDPDQVTKYLGVLKPERADAICKAVQVTASKPEKPVIATS